ncbi:hypothetical protein LTR86_010405 [Recurvomyces mirabilis]|nr:hypothetical protein LTR86_010405 [Recurvomyces mirabilis]
MSTIDKTIVLDPDGDLFLVLERPEEACVNDHSADVIPVPNGSSEDSPANVVPSPGIDTPDDAFIADVLDDGRPPNTNAYENEYTARALEHGHCGGEQTRTDAARLKVEMLVSWKHLSLASKVFAKATARTDSKDDRTIPLLQDDFGAMEILLNIIHGQTRRVPRQVNVQVLKQVVGLVDKYEFHEVAEVFTDMWFHSLQPTILTGQHQDLISVIFICFVLQRPSEYVSLTRRALWETDCELEDVDGLVPYWIFQDMRSRRQAILGEVFDTLSALLGRYNGTQRVCNQDKNCDPLALGKLITGLTKIGLHPIPESSTIKSSLKALFSSLNRIDLSSLCDNYSSKSRRSSYHWDQDASNAHMDKELQSSLYEIEQDIHGLELRLDV